MSANARQRMETWSPKENIECHVQAIQHSMELLTQG
jgi:hypothetical protein